MEHRLEQMKPSAVQLTTLAGAALRFSEQLKAGQSLACFTVPMLNCLCVGLLPTQDDFALLRSAIGDARIVMIGEATHGTEDFYQVRAELTKVLIDKLGKNLCLTELQRVY
jgi:erythromycin esterase-like protein